MSTLVEEIKELAEMSPGKLRKEMRPFYKALQASAKKAKDAEESLSHALSLAPKVMNDGAKSNLKMARIEISRASKIVQDIAGYDLDSLLPARMSRALKHGK